MDDCIIYFMAGSSDSDDVVLAFLILSLMTVRPHDRFEAPRPSAMRLASMAAQIGSASGLAVLARQSVEAAEDHRPRWMWEKKHRVQLVRFVGVGRVG
jgi:hypothetical protein